MEERKEEQGGALHIELDEELYRGAQEDAAPASEEDIGQRIEELKKGRIFSLNKMLIIIMTLCWFIPVIVMLIGFYNFYQNGINRKTQGLLQNEVRNAAAMFAIKLNDGITDSKNLSYQRNVETAWKSYRAGHISKENLYANISGLVNTSFRYTRKYDLSIMILDSDPNTILPDTLLGRRAYTDEVRRVAKAVSDSGSFSTITRIIDGGVYIIRNLYTVSGVEKYGTLVLKLNSEKIFMNISTNLMNNVAFSLNDSYSVITINKDGIEQHSIILDEARESRRYLEEDEIGILEKESNQWEGYVVHTKEKDYRLHTLLLVNKNEVYSNLRGMNMLIAGMLLVLVPLVLFVIYFLSRHVTTPISKLVEASHRIRGGDIGVQIPGEKRYMPNKEFAYLMVSFNKMSAKIRYLFDYAYNEQLARKDAQIMALQSQINPHFLNNTLEMMNWQARMAGDISVSKMIEALSTLLGYSMDRSNRRVISLVEEIRCAEAYLYIVSMRFGQRLIVEKEIDESLLQIQVPQLILQPLLENAVVHGVETKKRGTIWLKVHREGDEVLLEVLNTGNVMSEEDLRRVENILSGHKQIENKEGKHLSLGIRNVNQRIKLIYGWEYGLTIRPREKDITAAVIKIPYVERKN